MAVLDPVKLVITNWGEVMGGPDKDETVLDDCTAPVHPHHPEMGQRHFKIGREVWIERGDYEDEPPKGFYRLFPGNRVRLKYGHVIECTGAVRDGAGQLNEVRPTLVPDTKSGTPGANAVKVKGNVTWAAVADAVPASIRLYERLFSADKPGTDDLLSEINTASLETAIGFVEPIPDRDLAEGSSLQFERHGYFVCSHQTDKNHSCVFSRTAGLKDTWTK